MVKLGAVLSELADILGGDLAAKYLPLVGDMRKVKRFINAVLLMQIEKTNLGRTDFNKRDLNYIASYRDDLKGVFAVLDELAEEANPAAADPDVLQPTSL
nr:hypothetical protein [uncultured Roseateles sp.]